MKQEDSNPLEPTGDASIEARIVARVLGEASSFEAGEIDRLCEEQPELMKFRRRMEALDGLLEEAVVPVPDASWKLSAARRGKLETLLGVPPAAGPKTAAFAVKRHRHPWARHLLLAAAACVALGISLSYVLGPMSHRNAPMMASAPEVTFQARAPMAEGKKSAPLPSARMRAPSEIAAAPASPAIPEADTAVTPLGGSGGAFGQGFASGGGRSAGSDSVVWSNPETPSPGRNEFRKTGVEDAIASVAKEAGEKGWTAQDESTKARLSASALAANSRFNDATEQQPPAVVAPAADAEVASSAGNAPQPAQDRGPAQREISRRQVAAGEEADPIGSLASIIPPAKMADRSDLSAGVTGGNRSGVADIKSENIDEVLNDEKQNELAKNLREGEGNVALGKDAEARRNSVKENGSLAAHDGPARLNGAQAKADRSAYDQARGELLDQVDKDRELSVPREDKPSGAPKDDAVARLDRQKQAATRTAQELPARPEKQESDAGRPAEKAKPASSPAPRKPAPVPADETSAATEPFSTFSLHVSDASFKLAKAALDQGKRPESDSIRIEEFYNAFDYGDPAPAPGEPVGCAIEQASHPLIPQRNLVRIAMRTGSTGRGAGQPLSLTVLLDSSGSMEREDRRDSLKQAMARLASLLKPGDTVTLAGFARTPRLMADRLPGEQASKLVDIVSATPSEGGTNLEEALKLGEELALRQKNPAAQNRIVLLTDGAANLGNAKPEELAARIDRLRQQGIAFDAAGIGAGGLNDRLLETLTRNGNGRYYVLDGPGDADANFAAKLAGAFRPAAENVKVQIRFNPERVARYKLIGFEKHRLNKEDFRDDAVDAAEMAADEAGVALYQVELLPQGRGEIGEASVRFRDAASGGMVERTWPVPYDEKVPALDRATPSMQLATLAMLTGESLRGGPLADAVDFKELAPVISNVRNRYAGSPAVGDLIRMIGKLR